MTRDRLLKLTEHVQSKIVMYTYYSNNAYQNGELTKVNNYQKRIKRLNEQLEVYTIAMRFYEYEEKQNGR